MPARSIAKNCMTTSSRGRFSRRFTLDSNLLVYSMDGAEGERHELARQIVDRAVDMDCLLTLQSISEFYWATRRKAIPRTDAAAQAEDRLAVFTCIPVTAAAIRCALADSLAGRASYWDALLVSTAAEAGCAFVLTEDMAHGMILGGVEIHNPFAAGGGLTDLTRELLDL